jgi:hypothetical protein
MKNGAHDFITKPCSCRTGAIHSISSVDDHHASELEHLRQTQNQGATFIVGNTPEMKMVIACHKGGSSIRFGVDHGETALARMCWHDTFIPWSARQEIKYRH